jgi:hypothetical protein
VPTVTTSEQLSPAKVTNRSPRVPHIALVAAMVAVTALALLIP